MAKNKKNDLSFGAIMYLIAGLLMTIYFILNGGVPSPNAGILEFLVGLFTLIVLVGFYFYFLFGAKELGTVRLIAPVILLLILYGNVSCYFINDTVTKWFSSIAKMAYTLVIISGFVWLFVRHKIFGMVLGVASLVLAVIASGSYICILIHTLTNNGQFNLTSFILAVLLMASYALVGIGALKLKD